MLLFVQLDVTQADNSFIASKGGYKQVSICSPVCFALTARLTCFQCNLTAKDNTLSFVEPVQQRTGGSRRRRSTATTGMSFLVHGADAPMYGPANPAFDTRTMLSGAPTAIHLPMESVGGRNGASIAHPSPYRM
jgi:hypothetical protein